MIRNSPDEAGIWPTLEPTDITAEMSPTKQKEVHVMGAYDTFEDNGHGSKQETISRNTTSTESVYMSNVGYTIQFIQGDSSGGERHVGSKSYDSPLDLNRSRAHNRKIHVLEEVNVVVLAKTSNNYSAYGISHNHEEDFVPDYNDYLRTKQLRIRSPLLLNALRSIIRYSSSSQTEWADGSFRFPFADLYHHRQELLDYKKNLSWSRSNHSDEYNDECDKHIDILVHYLDNEPTVKFDAVQERLGSESPTMNFANFWWLIKPGTDVYVRENQQLNAYVVDQIIGGTLSISNVEPMKKYKIQVWNLVNNGMVIERKAKIIEIEVFDGEREITSLPLFPTRFYDISDGGVLRTQLIERGRRFFHLSKGHAFLEFTGLGLKKGRRRYNRARVVVEHQTLPWSLKEFASEVSWDLSNNTMPPPKQYHYKDGSPMPPPPPPTPLPTIGMPTMWMTELGTRARAPTCECSKCKQVYNDNGTFTVTTFSDYHSIDPNHVDGLTDHQAFVCMSHMFGFVLKDRAYDILDLNGLKEPTLAVSAIDDLVLRPESNKTTIKSIVRTYTESDSQADLLSVDFIRGKGEGQIFLLHGPPGTGKTLTAESVAEYTKRPLLSITAADLGNEPVELERNLSRLLQNATAWDAIVLLDEADVFLERRSPSDLRRNSVVSIFLRALDYFQGILFFTTNRVGHFDEAFLSRIHVSIGYDPLDDKAREQIWDTLFKKLKSNHKHGGPQINYEYDAKEYVRRSEDVRKLQWNGREIRNAFQTAVALAIADSKGAQEKGAPAEECVPLVTEAHLSQVVSMSAAFKRYIYNTHEGVDEADLAFRLGNRNDRLEPESR